MSKKVVEETDRPASRQRKKASLPPPRTLEQRIEILEQREAALTAAVDSLAVDLFLRLDEQDKTISKLSKQLTDLQVRG